MIDTRFLQYARDEEREAFQRPPVAAARAHDPVARLAQVAMLLGGAVIVVALAGWRGWLPLLLGLGLLATATAVYYRASYRGRHPGIQHDGLFFSSVTGRGIIGWALGILLTAFYVVLYWFPARLEPAIRMLDPLSHLLARRAADHWFLYGTLYTLAVLVFGSRMLMRYRHNRYQQIRTASVMFFQLGFAFLLPNLLKAFNQPEFYFTYFWPLKPEYLWPAGFGMGWILDSGRVGAFMIGWGIVMAFLATPVLTYFYGKRWYCSWVCGCGGLAETLGDPFRQLSNKSTRAWRVERVVVYSVLVLVVITTILLWINHATSGAVFGSSSASLKKWYGFYIGALFSGVIGVGFYPVMGARVWCRFGCPMAAILGIQQKLWSRFRITTNGGQCMSCGNCSTFCEMGIDVRAYAQQGLNIVRSSCVGCGVCAAVCPRGVLKLENGRQAGDRYPGASRPFALLRRTLRKKPRAGSYTG